MILFHRTTAAFARVILARGFACRGDVRLSTYPIERDADSPGDTIVTVVIEDRATLDRLDDYECRHTGKEWPEFLVPAAILNAVALVVSSEADAPIGGRKG